MTDVGVIDILSPTNATLSDAQPVTIRVRNFGLDPVSNVPVEFQLDSETPLTGMITDEIAPGAMVDYTFSNTVDASVVNQIYVLSSTTILPSDQDETNDAYTESVTNLMANDLGVIYISEPALSDTQPNEEDVTVTIKNFGGTIHENFSVNFSVNGGTAITEVVPGPLGPQEVMIYTFDTQADMNDVDDFVLLSFTSLPDDSEENNDGTTVVIEKNVCQPSSICGQGDGIRHLILQEIDNISECGTAGYSAFLDQVANLDQGVTYDMTITTEHGSQVIRAWVDFNDSFTFTGVESVLGNTDVAEGEGPGVYTAVLPVEIESDDEVGEHIMRVKTNRDSNVPGNSCTGTTFGETEDYKVIIGSVGLLESILGPNDIVVSTLGDGQFLFTLDSQVNNDPLTFRVMDTQGRTVVYNRIYPVNGVYTYDLDMSFAASGAYLIRIGNQRAGKITRIVVQ